MRQLVASTCRRGNLENQLSLHHANLLVGENHFLLYLVFSIVEKFAFSFFSAQVNSWKKRVANLTRELEDVKTDLNQ